MAGGKKFIASVFLLFFAVLQMADLHIIQHDVDDKDCVVCQISSSSQTDDYYTFQNTDYTIECIETPVNRQAVVYTFASVNPSSVYICSNKAPPVIV